MKFGLFYNPMVPKRRGATDWDEGQEREKYREMFEQVQLADRLGFDYVFLGEHHFAAEYAHNTSPEVLLGGLAACTKNIRIGTGIVHASHNHPVRTAERVATIDLISDGRMEFGFGSGGPEEVAPFLADNLSQRGAIAAAAAQVSVDILGSSGWWEGVDNEFFQFPPVNVLPKPVQRPHPPLWTSTIFPEQTPGVALKGLGNLLLAVFGPDTVAHLVRSYWESLRSPDLKPIGKAINPAVFTFTNALIAPTQELAVERGREGIEFFGWGLSGGAMAIVGSRDTNLWDAFQEWKAGGYDLRERAGTPDFVREMGAHFADLPGTMLDSPEGALEKARAFEATNVDGLLFNQQFGNTKHEHLMESIELLGTKVIPEFRERHYLHEAWRKEQLDGIDFPVMTSV
jgi:alkanesulfonate monooxygenase SsuD/methylene tetrahydromethanopterin reductase-like flavin-dependent oxidoreductase (luciferase family)